ncbi:alkaline phosphatase [Andreprevotia lacus DSM 23236]|jgi:alkaline phosphatase|uniref:Alkaline phosphatase n=1 Tax=Andreprevotia lacus DSM 23236 TaxID=1121001 RepID=A0A1W1XP07_9NEIS|nr:alkaline phosphatase [Andreprevotia lacus]SMC25703.1 alkaline phosphatase [Andreprevotia lacus DSM 23236]
MKRLLLTALACSVLAACGSSDSSSSTPLPDVKPQAKNVIFFLGDGMGIATTTAARIYAAGEDGELTMDTLPETAFIKTYSNDAMVTDSAPSMSAYMTGVKMNNEVISMSQDTKALDPTKDLTSNCGTGNGKPVETILEIAKAQGLSTGVVTTTRVTHATPAATYSHVCHRDAENDIAAQFVPGGAGYNSKLADGVDVLLGGGRQFFQTTKDGGKRADGRDLIAELKGKGYSYASNKAELDAIDVSKTKKYVGLFTSSHMSYDLDRDASKEPSLADMTVKALQTLKQNNKGYFLMVEGGRIDHALHETTARKALQDTVAFDTAIKAAIDEVKKTDPTLKNTLIVVTADHDHTLVLNGYAARTGKTSASSPGVLGLLRNYTDGQIAKDADGMPFTIIGFGNGENRAAGDRKNFPALDDNAVFASTYHQEAAIRVSAGNETHGGTNVFLGAIGNNADLFHGVMDNTNVFNLLRQASGI